VKRNKQTQKQQSPKEGQTEMKKAEMKKYTTNPEKKKSKK